MAVENAKSTWITNADAVPLVLTNDYLAVSRVHRILGKATMAASASNGSVYRIGRLPSNAKVSSIKIAISANTSMTSVGIGVLRTAANGGAVAQTGSDAIFLATADLHSGLTTLTEKLTLTLTNFDKRVWELCGTYTADPNEDFDLAVTQVAAGSDGGTVVVACDYTL